MSPAAYHAAMARILKHLKIVCDAQTIPYDVIANSLAPALMGSSMNAARASQLLLDLITGAEQFVHLFPKSLRVFQGTGNPTIRQSGLDANITMSLAPTSHRAHGSWR